MFYLQAKIVSGPVAQNVQGLPEGGIVVRSSCICVNAFVSDIHFVSDSVSSIFFP